MSQDISFMRHALALARRGLGQVAPNPSVGCVIVRDGRIVGRGWTQPGGRPHAEPLPMPVMRHAGRQSMSHWSLVRTMARLRPALMP